MKKWSQVRTGWPDKEIHLFGAGVDSGTYDYFTKAIVGEEHASRGDFTSSEDDNVLVQGVARDPLALGFFGFAYYDENQDKLKLVVGRRRQGGQRRGPDPAVARDGRDGTYQPLARPIFIYVKQAATRPEVAELRRVLPGARRRSWCRKSATSPLPGKAYELARRRFDQGQTGSMFDGAARRSASRWRRCSRE